MATQNYTLRDQTEGNIPFNYSSSAEDIKRQQRIADALNSWKLEGKVSPWQVLAKALTSYMAGKRMYDASESQKSLDTQSRDEYNKAWDMFTTPSDAEKSALQDPYLYKHADPNSVGPTMDQLTGVSASGVRPSSVQGTPLAAVGDQPTKAQLERAAGEAVLTGAGKPTAQQIERAVLPDTSSAPVGVMGQPIVRPQAPLPASVTTPQTSSGPPQALAGAVAARAAQAQPQQAASQAPPQALPQAVAARPQGAMNPNEIAALQAAGMNAQDLGPDFVADRGAAKSALVGAMQAEAQRKRGAMDALYNSGPRGQKEYDALRAAQLAKMVKEKDVDEWNTTSLGEGGFVTTNKRTGETKTFGLDAGTSKRADKEKREQGEFELKVQKELAPVEMGITDGQSAIDKIDRFIALNSKYNAYGGALSSVAGSIGKAFGSDAANEYDMASKDVKASLLKQIFGGAPTEGERAYLDDVFGAFSAGKAPTERAMTQLRSAVQARLNTNRAIADRYRGLLPPSTPSANAPAGASQGATSKSGLDWMPAR